jgi:tetratricopeptide (TPR) repeat protein
LEQIEKYPDNADLYNLLGKVYFNRQNWPGVLAAWEKSLAINPNNAEVLNNLAWTYATCEDQKFQDPHRALAMATLAVRLENQPHIWDTLAESYYVNQMYGKAVEAGRKALALARDNRSYYEGQLEKFKKAGGY